MLNYDPDPELIAEELDDHGRPGARLAEGDPAVLAQGELLALQQQLGVALEGDVGAVGAVVLEDELVAAALHGAVPARGHVIVDHQAAARLAADHHRGAVAPAPHPAAPGQPAAPVAGRPGRDA